MVIIECGKIVVAADCPLMIMLIGNDILLVFITTTASFPSVFKNAVVNNWLLLATLATLLAPLKSDYDLIIIDTVPTPSVYTNNAIVASDYVMIPLQAEEESTNNIQNYISYLIDLQEQFNPGLDMIGFVPYLVDTDSATIKSNLEELYKQHKEDNLVFQNIIKRSNKVSTWSKNGITEHKGYDKKVLSMYKNVFFEMLERIIQLENEKE